MSSNIIAFPRREKGAEPLLARVEFDAESAKITITDGIETYFAAFTKSQIAKFPRAHDSDFFETFRQIMLGESHLPDIDMVASLQKSCISILVRESKEVPLKICAFEVPISNDVEVVLFSWALEAVKSAQIANTKAKSLSAELLKAEERSRESDARLQDLTSQREAHERMLFSKFATLLNKKKEQLRHDRDTAADVDKPKSSKKQMLKSKLTDEPVQIEHDAAETDGTPGEDGPMDDNLSSPDERSVSSREETDEEL